MTEKRHFGDFGEKKVRRYLRKKKYKIIDCNYSAKCEEIDIIVVNKTVIAFVEVKTRRVDSMVRGIYAVDAKKQARIKKTALKYITENAIELQPRFDVAEVEVTDGIIKKAKINYIENAY